VTGPIPAPPPEESVAPHIGYWDSRPGSWRPWCEVYGGQWMPKERPKPPTDDICADCFALAIGEIETGGVGGTGK